mmetsp:Transcript_7126/g.23983  ORF Transcript_7126/g.23983 Transcript_7126/m.23983 type:complete len:207 (-) Transcript_7126:42-662(-)
MRLFMLLFSRSSSVRRFQLSTPQKRLSRDAGRPKRPVPSDVTSTKSFTPALSAAATTRWDMRPSTSYGALQLSGSDSRAPRAHTAAAQPAMASASAASSAMSTGVGDTMGWGVTREAPSGEHSATTVDPGGSVVVSCWTMREPSRPVAPATPTLTGARARAGAVAARRTRRSSAATSRILARRRTPPPRLGPRPRSPPFPGWRLPP